MGCDMDHTEAAASTVFTKRGAVSKPTTLAAITLAALTPDPTALVTAALAVVALAASLAASLVTPTLTATVEVALALASNVPTRQKVRRPSTTTLALLDFTH